MYSNVGGLNLSGKDPRSNSFGRTQVYLYMCVCVYVCLCVYMYICMCVCIYSARKRERERLVSSQKDSNSDSSHSNLTLRHSNTRSTPLKLIYIILSIYKSKIKCFEYFLPIHQAAQNGQPKVVSWLDLCL